MQAALIGCGDGDVCIQNEWSVSSASSSQIRHHHPKHGLIVDSTCDCTLERLLFDLLPQWDSRKASFYTAHVMCDVPDGISKAEKHKNQ